MEETDVSDRIRKYDHEAGETPVLSQAVERGHEDVLVDEESVRDVARLHDLQPHGTLYFLFRAIQRDQLGFEGFLDALDALLEEGFYLDEAVYLDADRNARRLAGDE